MRAREVPLLFAGLVLGIIAGCGASGSRANASGAPAVQRGPSCEEAHRSYIASTAFAQASPDKAGEVPVEAYGDVLNYGSYFSHCPVEDRAEDLDLRRGAKRTRSRRHRHDIAALAGGGNLIDRAVRGLHFRPHPKLEVARTFFGAAGAPPWENLATTPPRKAPRDSVPEKREHGERERRSVVRPTLVAMPELWSKLVLADPTLERRGIQTNFEVEIDGGRRDLALRVLDSLPDIEALLKSPGLLDMRAAWQAVAYARQRRRSASPYTSSNSSASRRIRR